VTGIQDGQARDQALAAMDPDERALHLAQKRVRAWHPKLTMPLPGDHERASQTMRWWLAGAGHPDAARAYAVRHYQRSRRSSNTGRGPDGEPMALLHRERWDYGTLAHETAHLVRDHEAGRQAGGLPPPDGTHGPAFAGHYARLLDTISRGAGDDLLAAYSAQLAADREAG